MSLANGKKIRIIADALERLASSFCKKTYQLSGKVPWTFGYSNYKYDYIGEIINGPSLQYFVNMVLPHGYGYRLDERVVEYPWFLSRLRDSDKNLLDAGSVLNYRQLLASKKIQDKNLYITTLYYEGRPYVIPSPSYIYEDLRTLCYRDNFFDAICSLSTLEHIGLDNTKIYTPDSSKNENDKYAYLQAIEELHRVLKPGGILYLSMPFGSYKNHEWFQVFDGEMVERLLACFKPTESEISFFRYENDQWNVADQGRCMDGYCFDPLAGGRSEADFLAFSRCVICLALTK